MLEHAHSLLLLLLLLPTDYSQVAREELVYFCLTKEGQSVYRTLVMMHRGRPCICHVGLMGI